MTGSYVGGEDFGETGRTTYQTVKVTPTKSPQAAAVDPLCLFTTKPMDLPLTKLSPTYQCPLCRLPDLITDQKLNLKTVIWTLNQPAISKRNLLRKKSCLTMNEIVQLLKMNRLSL